MMARARVHYRPDGSVAGVTRPLDPQGPHEDTAAWLDRVSPVLPDTATLDVDADSLPEPARLHAWRVADGAVTDDPAIPDPEPPVDRDAALVTALQAARDAAEGATTIEQLRDVQVALFDQLAAVLGGAP